MLTHIIDFSVSVDLDSDPLSQSNMPTGHKLNASDARVALGDSFLHFIALLALILPPLQFYLSLLRFFCLCKIDLLFICTYFFNVDSIANAPIHLTSFAHHPHLDPHHTIVCASRGYDAFMFFSYSLQLPCSSPPATFPS